jgi:hypothetical protein
VVNPGQGPHGVPGRPTDHELAVYEVIAFRRMQYEAMMWQVPALSLTAQAFLLTIALGPDSKPMSRVVTGLLSAVVALVSVQLMLKHRRHELIDSKWLEKFEVDHGLDGCTRSQMPGPPGCKWENHLGSCRNRPTSSGP